MDPKPFAIAFPDDVLAVALKLKALKDEHFVGTILVVYNEKSRLLTLTQQWKRETILVEDLPKTFTSTRG